MTTDEKYECLECARINDHEAFKGFYSAKMGFWEILRQTPKSRNKFGMTSSVTLNSFQNLTIEF